MLDGVRTRFAGDSSFYSCESIERGEAFSNLLGYDVDNEMERRLVDFAETAVDLVVGELKNNVVQLGTEGDETDLSGAGGPESDSHPPQRWTFPVCL